MADELNEIVEKLTAAEKKLKQLRKRRQYKTGIELNQNIIDITHVEEEIERLNKLKESYWEGYEDDYEEAPPEYNFWDDRTWGA